jgi:cob(I)alamin adenosyltransferase
MVKRTALFTGTGDDGYTDLLGKERVPKYDLRPEAYGTVDECSSFMGLVRAAPAASERTKKLVLGVQRDLWVLMGELAAGPGVKLPKRLEAERTVWLEEETSKLGREFPLITQFVVPGDTQVGAWLDVARAVARRAERYVVKLSHQEQLGNPEIIGYLNRLSSLLFALARYEEHLAGYSSTLAKEVK